MGYSIQGSVVMNRTKEVCAACGAMNETVARTTIQDHASDRPAMDRMLCERCADKAYDAICKASERGGR